MGPHFDPRPNPFELQHPAGAANEGMAAQLVSSDERFSLMIGGDGSGRSVALARAASRARDSGRVVVSSQQNDSPKGTLKFLVKDVRKELYARSRWRWTVGQLRQKASFMQGGISFLGVGFRVPEEFRGQSDQKALEISLRQLAATAKKRGEPGITLCVDDLERASTVDMRGIFGAVQNCAKDGVDVRVIGVGSRGARDSATIAQWGRHGGVHSMRPMTWEEASKAVQEPAGAWGVRWAPGALEAVMQGSCRNPGTLQEMCREAWEQSDRRRGDVITEQQARQAVLGVQRRYGETALLDLRGLSSEVEVLLRKFARERTADGQVAWRDVARHRSQDPEWVETQVQQAVQADLVRMTGSGHLEFSRPGLAEYFDATSSSPRKPRSSPAESLPETRLHTALNSGQHQGGAQPDQSLEDPLSDAPTVRREHPRRGSEALPADERTRRTGPPSESSPNPAFQPARPTRAGMGNRPAVPPSARSKGAELVRGRGR